MSWSSEDRKKVIAEIDSTFDLFCHSKLGSMDEWLEQLQEFPVEAVIEAFEKYRRSFVEYIAVTGYSEEDAMTVPNISEVLVLVYEIIRQ